MVLQVFRLAGCGIAGAEMFFRKDLIMNNSKTNLRAVAYICAFVIGVILLWSIGQAWLDFESRLVFISGVLGVAVSVLLFAAWNMTRHSNHKDH